MPVTVLDPKTALVVIDLQKGIVALPVAHPVEGILERVRTLAVALQQMERHALGGFRADARQHAQRLHQLGKASVLPHEARTAV